MTSQGQLFAGDSRRESGKARRKDPDTAKAAARSVDATKLEQIVLDALAVRGMTSYELSIILDMSLVSVSPRLRPLVEKGLVRDSGVRRTNPSGKKAIVWEVV